MLNQIKTMLGIPLEDTSQDDVLRLLIEMVTARLTILLGGIEPPETMEHIIVEVVIIRFNRIGSEGMTSHSVEGESISFGENDFDGFADEIQAFLSSQKDTTRGRLVFL